MKQKSETIIYLEFLDHSSTTNAWQSYEEYNEDCKIEPCKAIGFLEKEDKLAFYLSSMKSSTELGSGHIILKSAVTYVKKFTQKSDFKGIEHILSSVLVEYPTKD
jgi:hypothetical protein